ncbi:NAD(P)H-binding protein, partial [Chryseobacterium sp.]|uniref:NAD-dependent epimerase/dehydratase family protein n=1 Tax=Chryseobacterium sp. TaxID=1871047 RepID=UPI00321A9B64
MKKILITGVTGYIGGTIAQKLLKKNYTVTGLIRNENQAEALKLSGIEPIVGSIHDEIFLKAAVKDVDAVVHNADSADDAYAADSFVNILQDTGKTLIFTSGSAIFGGKENGEGNNFVFTESISLNPRFEMASRVL